MIPWELTIRRGENGYRLSWKEELDENQVAEKEAYIEELFDGDDKEIEARTAQKLLWEILEQFGIYGDKYGKCQVQVKLEHGRKFECTGCEICKEEI